MAISEIGWFILFLVFLLVGIVIIVVLSHKSGPILNFISNLLRFGA
ncbi:MAG: hypothetical protein GWP09_01230 [Nitrospiraceae bacterium]|nr:hypothetical protein [Nitrospiraceae bacterium]